MQGFRELPQYPGRALHVGQFHAQAGDVAAQPIQLLRILEMDQGQPRVILEHAHAEDAHHGELLDPRQHTGRRHHALRRNQRQLVALERAQGTRQISTQDDAKFTGFQVGQAPAGHFPGELRHLVFFFRQQAADQCPLGFAAQRQQRLAGDIRRHATHFRMLCHLPRQLRPVRQLPTWPADFHVRGHPQNAVAQFLLETVHHGEHHNQRHHPEGNARHRGHGDKGNKVVAALGAGIAQADGEFVGQHGGRSLPQAGATR